MKTLRRRKLSHEGLGASAGHAAQVALVLGWSVSLWLVLAAAGCESEPEPTWWEGEFVRYTSSVDLVVCAGTQTRADDFVPFLVGELGIKTPSRINYRWLSTDEYKQSDCPASTLGCAFGTRVYAIDPLLPHELVHPVTQASGMNDLHFLSEGLATAYDPFSGYVDPRDSRDFAVDLRDPRPEMLLSKEELSYRTAGNFVAFLLARYGAERMVRLSQASRNGDDLDTIRSKFFTAYGVGLDDEAELFMKSELLACDEDYFIVRPQDCTMTEIEWSDGGWAYESRVDCDDDDVSGGYGYLKSRSVTLTVPTGGQYLVHAFGDGGRRVRLGRCFGCPWQHEDVILINESPDVVATLEPGIYFVRTEVSADDAPLVGVTIKPAP